MSAQTAERQRQRRLRAMARALWTGDRVGAEAARAEGLDADLARSAPARLNEDGTTALGLVSGADARGLLGLVSGAHAQRLEPHASAPSAVPSLVSASSTSSSPPVSLPASPPPSPRPAHVIEQQERGCLHVHALVQLRPFRLSHAEPASPSPSPPQAAVDYYLIKYMAKPLDVLHMRRTDVAQPVDRAFLESLDAVSEDDDECWRFAPVGVPAHYERDILNLDEVD